MKKSLLRQENEKLLNSDLVIHWWNFRKKTLQFKGTVKEYLENTKVKYKIKYYQDETYNFERCLVTCDYSFGNLKNVKLTTHDMEDFIRMVLNINLSYLGDKSQFVFKGRVRTINF